MEQHGPLAAVVMAAVESSCSGGLASQLPRVWLRLSLSVTAPRGMIAGRACSGCGDGRQYGTTVLHMTSHTI